MVDAEELGRHPEERRRHGEIDKPELKRAFGTDGNLGETARPHQGLDVTDREGGRQLRRILRSQRRLRLKARDCPRAQPALDQGRNPVRAADPLTSGCGDEHRAPRATAAVCRHAAACARGRAGWRGFFVQILFVAALAWIGYEIAANARANLETQRITSGFGFLANTAGFDVSQNLIPYSGSDPYTRVLLSVCSTLSWSRSSASSLPT